MVLSSRCGTLCEGMEGKTIKMLLGFSQTTLHGNETWEASVQSKWSGSVESYNHKNKGLKLSSEID